MIPDPLLQPAPHRVISLVTVKRPGGKSWSGHLAEVVQTVLERTPVKGERFEVWLPTLDHWDIPVVCDAIQQRFERAGAEIARWWMAGRGSFCWRCEPVLARPRQAAAERQIVGELLRDFCHSTEVLLDPLHTRLMEAAAARSSAQAELNQAERALERAELALAQAIARREDEYRELVESLPPAERPGPLHREGAAPESPAKLGIEM